MEKAHFIIEKKMRELPFFCSDKFDGRQAQLVLVKEDEIDTSISLQAIPPPQTPAEPMEFLSRSWSLSALEISRALLAGNNNRGNETGIGKWVPQGDLREEKSGSKKKMRMARARIHAAVSVAKVAAAVAAKAAGMRSENPGSKMSSALASATELLALHCVEMAEMTGARQKQVDDAVKSAVDVRTVGDLVTLTAAAATALRGVGALKQRVQREAIRSNAAAVRPYERGSSCVSPDIWCKEGVLLKRSRNGALHWKKVSLYMNSKSQVMVKIKSKHIGGALSKKKKSVVLDVYDEELEWSGLEGKDEEIRVSFGLRTAEGNIVFVCADRFGKQKWVEAVQNLLRQANGMRDGNCRIGRSM